MKTTTTTTEIHVTSIRNGGAYGHRATACDPSGCACARELYLVGTAPETVERGHVHEIADDSGDVLAEVQS